MKIKVATQEKNEQHTAQDTLNLGLGRRLWQPQAAGPACCFPSSILQALG
jgi:hypothetical protein